jgi:hypothetical protein
MQVTCYASRQPMASVIWGQAKEVTAMASVIWGQAKEVTAMPRGWPAGDEVLHPSHEKCRF